MRIPSGVTDQYIYFVAVDATDLKTRETGLSAFTVRRSRNGAASAAYTTPTVNETDSSNMPGVYELLLDEDMTIDSGDQSQEVCLHITCTGMAPVTRIFELYRPSVTAGETLTVASGVGQAAVQTIANNALTAAAINADAFTAAKFAADVTTELQAGLATAAALTTVGNYIDTEVAAILAAVDTEVAAIKAVTDALPNAGALTSLATAANLATVAGYIDTEIGTILTNLATVDAVVDAILVDTAVIGAAGAGLTAVPWNAAWDAEVQSEAADALSAYDPPTKAELDAAVAPLATAAGLAVVDAIADKLDTALELDGAVYRFTTNALEQAPTGGSAPTASAIADEVQTRTIAAVTVVNGLAANTVTASALAADAVTEIQSGLAGAPDLAAVKAKTDNLPTDPADQSLIIAATDAIITAIDAVPTNAELATALAAADDAVLAAISTLSGAVATVDTVVDALAVSLAVVDGLVDAMTVRVSDMWQLQGLDGSNPAVFTPAAFDVGTIHINVTGDGTATTTLTRTT